MARGMEIQYFASMRGIPKESEVGGCKSDCRAYCEVEAEKITQ